jgi:acyl carrier protein
VAPHTSMERALAAIWAEVLGLEQLGIHDNFFALGGHSLLATRVIARVREQFQVELPVHTLFEEPTVAHLAEAIEQAQQHSQTVPRIHARPRGDKTVGQFLTELDHLAESESKAMLHKLERSAR